jgi:hypothetical protein
MARQGIKYGLGPAKQEDDQRNDEKRTEYAAANIHKNLRLTESVCCARLLLASVRCRTDMDFSLWILLTTTAPRCR